MPRASTGVCRQKSTVSSFNDCGAPRRESRFKNNAIDTNSFVSRPTKGGGFPRPSRWVCVERQNFLQSERSGRAPEGRRSSERSDQRRFKRDQCWKRLHGNALKHVTQQGTQGYRRGWDSAVSRTGRVFAVEGASKEAKTKTTPGRCAPAQAGRTVPVGTGPVKVIIN